MFHCMTNVLSVIILVAVAGHARGAFPDVEEIGRILGYPGAELVITDVTAQERRIYSLQSASEEEKGIAPPIGPEQIRSAYRITGRTPESFLPILITIADEGTFLGSEVREILDQLAAVSRADLIKQNAGHLGPFELNDGSEGGLIFGKLRMPSPFEETEAPRHAMATITEVSHPRNGIDIRVAMQFALDQEGNVDLVEMPGGERYYAYFRDLRGPFETPSPGTPAFDWLAAFKGLNRVALMAYMADQESTSAGARSPDRGDEPAGTKSQKALSGSIDRKVGRGSADGERSWMMLITFAVVGVIVLVLLGALLKRKLE